MTNKAKNSLAQPSQTGFTLIELVVAVAIIVSLMTIGVVSYTQVQKNARDAQRKSDLQSVALALEKFNSEFGGYPIVKGDPDKGKIQINSTSCVQPALSPLEWGSSAFTCNSKTYLSALPHDPLYTDANKQYCFVSGDTFSMGSYELHQSYWLYADMEGKGNRNLIDHPGGCPGSEDFNYVVKKVKGN